MAPTIDPGNKRKRHTDGSSKPSKRVAIDDSKDVKISLREGDKWAPIIASTPGLAIPTSIPLTPYSRLRANASKNHSQRSDIAASELLLRSADDTKLQYTAREEEEDEEEGVVENSEPFLKHYVGVYDPETGKLEVLEARSMTVRATVRAHQPPVEDIGATNMRAQRNALGEAFGTKKAKKAILSVTENAISPDKSARNKLANGTTKLDSVSSAMMANMAEATASMATREELDNAMNANKPRPKANTETTDLSKVYTVETLIGTETMTTIQVRPWQVEMKAQREVMVASRFVANRLNKFKDNVEKLKMLRYMLLLIEFYNSTKPGRDGRRLPKPDELKPMINGQPESLLQGVKRKFADGSMMSRHSADLLITHLCAIAMVVDNFEVDIWDLKDDLKLEVAGMTLYFKEIGAKIVAFPEGMRKAMKMEKAAASQRKLARLKIPLEFPTTKFVRASKR